MSVNDLRAAEEHIEYLRHLVDALKEHGVGASDRLIDVCRNPWCRPSCAEGCDEFCGCLAHGDGKPHHDLLRRSG